ncbi:MAG: ATP-binding protein [Syntrophomonadaceae bacterium]
MENEGSPVREADLKKIWLPFYRQEKSRSKEYGGTGLGLTIAQNIFNLHHSDYGLENTGRGVRFYFSLKKQADQE